MYLLLLWFSSLLVTMVCGIPRCTAEDKAYVFSPCGEDGLMMSVEYFTRLCELQPPMAVNPPRATPCVMPCQSGEWYSPRTIDCQRCMPGQYSNSGGLLLTDFSQFPAELSTFCSPTPCSPWRVSPGLRSLDSGDQSGHRYAYGFVDETVSVSLLTVANVINRRPGAGKLIFEYRVESERGFDGLVVYLNDTSVVNPEAKIGEGRFWSTGIQYHWLRAEIPLPLGRTTIRWVYEKDVNQGAVFTGNDKAFLRNIVIEGVQLFAPACKNCPAGTFANSSGSMSCQDCPHNTFSTSGSSFCTPCPAGYFSSVDSAICSPIPACTDEDYVASYSECRGNQRTQTWKLLHQGTCIERSPRLTSTVPCAPCPEGTFKDASGMCLKCERGLARINGQCSFCPSGTAAIPVVSFTDGFDRFGDTIPSEYFSMSCDGMCNCPEDQLTCTTSGGFHLASFPSFDEDHTIVGIRQNVDGDTFTATLRFSFNMVSDGYLTFSYVFFRQVLTEGIPPELTAYFEIDGIPERLDPYHIGVRLNQTISRRVTGAGAHTFALTVIKGGSISADVAVALLSIEVVGDSRGSASQCRNCPVGHYCPGGGFVFAACAPGTAQSMEGAAGCNECGPGQIAKEPGSFVCSQCALGTIAEPNRRLCESTCDMTISDNRFDLTALKQHVFGPVFLGTYGNYTQAQADAAGVQRYFFSPCNYANEGGRRDVCPFNHGSVVESAYACQRINDNRSYSIGDDVAFGVEGSQLKMYLTGGDVCRIEGGAPRSSTISFVCNRDVTPGDLQFIGESPTCHYNFIFTSSFACPLCVATSFDRVVAGCVNNTRRVTYFRTDTAASCVGGYVPPPNAYVSCMNCNESMYDLVWSECTDNLRYPNYVLRREYSSCYEMHPPNFELRPVSCRTVDATVGANPFTVGVLVVMLVVCLLGAGLYLLHRRHQDLQHRYERLSSSHGGRELSPMEESCNAPSEAVAREAPADPPAIADADAPAAAA